MVLISVYECEKSLFRDFRRVVVYLTVLVQSKCDETVQIIGKIYVFSVDISVCYVQCQNVAKIEDTIYCVKTKPKALNKMLIRGPSQFLRVQFTCSQDGINTQKLTFPSTLKHDHTFH